MAKLKLVLRLIEELNHLLHNLIVLHHLANSLITTLHHLIS